MKRSLSFTTAVTAAILASAEAPASADEPQEPLPQLPAPEPKNVPSPATTPNEPASAALGGEPPADTASTGPRPDAPGKMRTSVRAAVGGTYAQVHGVPILGGRARLGIGSETASSAHYATISMLYGSTENELRAWDIRAGWLADLWRFGIIRIGFDAEIGYLTIRRASVEGRLWALGAGGGLHVSGDVFQFGPRDEQAVTLEARFDVSLHFGGAVLWSPSLLVGFRF